MRTSAWAHLHFLHRPWRQASCLPWRVASLPPGPGLAGSGASGFSIVWQKLTPVPAGLEARLHVSQGWLTLPSRVSASRVFAGN